MSLEGYQLGHYRLQRLIGSGGMGEIYLAQDTHIPRLVAVKVLRAERDFASNSQETQEAERLFEREMKAISLLDHHHILPIFDYGTEQIGEVAPTYLVMPYRPEGSLSNWLRQQNSTSPLDPSRVVHIVRQAADALQHAHDRHILHQDIKPSNFLIRVRNSAAEVPDILLADFGIAKFLDATFSASQSVRGTPTYMAPEQWEGRPVPASDQYSLAVMAFLLLTGRLPFRGSAAQVMHQHLTASPPVPSTINPRLSPEVDAVLLRALAKQPQERFPSVLHFAQALEQAVQESGLQAGGLSSPALSPPSNMYSSFSTQYSPTPVATPVITPFDDQASAQTVRESQPAQPASRLSRAHKLLLITVAALLVLGGSGVAIFYALGRPTSSSSQTLVTATTTQNNTQPTAIATTTQGTATDTLQAVKGATATALANDPYLNGKGTLLISDPLSTPKYWQANTSGPSGGTCTFKNGAYYAYQGVVGRATDCNALPALQGSNIIFEVQATIVSGDCGGIRFRYNPDTHLGYVFHFCHNGKISLVGQNGNLYGSVSSAVRQGYGQSNIIAAVANGNQIRLYINKQLIVAMTDGAFSQGKFCLDARANTSPTNVAYNNAKIWQL